MKILFITNVLMGGGREKRLVQLIKSLSASYQYEVSLVVLSDNSNIDYPEVFDCKCNVTFLSDAGGQINYKKLVKLIAEFGPQIVHCWCINIRLLCYLIYAKVLHKFTLISGFVADGNRIPFFSTANATTHLAFWLSNHVVSNSMAGLIAKKAPLSKSTVIYNGFDYCRFRDDFDKGQVLKNLGLQEGKFIISMIARFNKEKDWDSFVNTAYNLRNYTDIIFLSVGKGDTLHLIQERVKELQLNNILFLGFRQDVEDIIRISDLSMLWSNNEYHAEGISNSIMESMAAGVPVIASIGGGTGEIITDGVNGFTIEPRDVETATRIIRTLISDKDYYNKISCEASRTIHDKFLLSTMTNHYIELYNNLLTSKQNKN